MKNLLISISVGFVAAFLILGNTHITIKSIDQLGAAQPSIEELLAQLKSLQAQLAAKQAQVSTTYQFTRVLKVGDKGEDVRQLQILLNKDTLTQIAVSGDGSPGKETTYFGPATSRAVLKFQEKYKSEILTPNQLTKGTGTVGNATLKKLNALIAVTKTTGTPGNVSVVTNNPNVTNTTPTQVNSTTTQTNPTQTNTTSTSSSLLPPTNCGAPVITSATSASGTVGSAFNYTITITSIAAPTFSVSGLPNGLSLSGSSIVGTPSVAGTYQATITATSNCGTGTKVVTITIANQQTQVSGTIITPGTGFSGATAQPANQGSSSQFGYADNTIARWDVVPYQTFDTTFNVGLLAFHNSGIAHVDFSVNGGPWTSVSQMTANPQTINTSGIGNPNSSGVIEYWATLRATDFAKDGLVEIRAIAYPNVGVPRVLDPIYLNTNANHTLPSLVRYVATDGSDTTGDGTESKPFKTTNQAAWSISQAQGDTDGGIIYLKSGSYILSGAAWYNNSSNKNRWLTVTHAPNLTRSDVKITSTEGSGFNTKLVKFYDVTVTGDLESGGGAVSGAGWADSVWFQGASANTGMAGLGTSWSGGKYITNSSMVDNLLGPTDYTMTRNVHAERIAGDVFSNTPIVINSSASYVAINAPAEVHADIYQWVSAARNVILYNVDASDHIDQAQGFQFNYSPTDVALVNVNIPNNWFQMGSTLTNLYTKNSNLYLLIIENGINTLIANDVVFESMISNPNNYLPTWPGVYYKDSSGISNVNTSASFTITATAQSGGTISPSGATIVKGTGSQTFTMTGNSGYEVSSVVVDGVTQGAISTYTFTNVTKNHTIVASFTQSYGPPNVSSGLVGYWNLDEGSGTTLRDSSGHNYNGSLSGGSWVDGKFGKAIQISGGFADIGNPQAFNMSAGKVSVSAWVKRIGSGAAPSWEGIAGRWNWSSALREYILMYNRDTGGFRFMVTPNGTSESAVVSNVFVTNNTWYHVVGVADGSNLQMYVNGQLQSSAPYNNSIFYSPNQDFVIGNGGAGDQYWNGQIDDVRVYNRPLSPTEVQQLYNGTLAYKSSQSFSASVWSGFVGAMTDVGSTILDILKLR